MSSADAKPRAASLDIESDISPELEFLGVPNARENVRQKVSRSISLSRGDRRGGKLLDTYGDTASRAVQMLDW